MDYRTCHKTYQLTQVETMDNKGLVTRYLLLKGIVKSETLYQSKVTMATNTHLKFPGQHSATIHIAGIRLDGLVVAKDLSSRGSGHWS